ARRERSRIRGRSDHAQGARGPARGLTVLPETYEPAAVVVMVLGGALACFAGYRLFRVVLAIYGFIFGAMMASSVMGATNTFGTIVAAIVGGIVGALILVF